MLSRTRRRERTIDYWPGFVDALSTMLLVIIFLLSVFMLAQFFLAREVTGKDKALSRLDRQINDLSTLLALEHAAKDKAEQETGQLKATLEAAQTAAKAEATRLQELVDAGNQATQSAEDRARLSLRALDAEKQLSTQAEAQVETLNQQIAALRGQLSSLQETLSASETRDQESRAQIADLGSRLNVALAQKVQELAHYRSDFFGRLRQVLGERPDLRIVGDRFVFQSELLFDSGQARLNPIGRQELDTLATALNDLVKTIPADLPWVMRVDGHTDKKQIKSVQFPSNWELSVARALAVVHYLTDKGVPPDRLAAAGFGSFQPLDPGDSEEALKRNRRIELKITEK
ncbi:OmpA/MotB domain protein [Beijerinckia indica subsp. indica ATCC 9039]|uniref:OmpA/MotB domain protein n=2 Tax=Beijerinckia TaxID=532 RepID=B2IDX0_BEII9|nr:OmpA/MotB domain protein [Beijerinckia indica subsp. indica ATCC 9039]